MNKKILLYASYFLVFFFVSIADEGSLESRVLGKLADQKSNWQSWQAVRPLWLTDALASARTLDAKAEIAWYQNRDQQYSAPPLLIIATHGTDFTMLKKRFKIFAKWFGGSDIDLTPTVDGFCAIPNQTPIAILEMAERLSRLYERNTEVLFFQWSGGYSLDSICGGGKSLAVILNALAQSPTYCRSSIITIAHSNGGNVVMKAISHNEETKTVQLPAQYIINIATPNLLFSNGTRLITMPNNVSCPITNKSLPTTVINIFFEGDFMQLGGSFMHTKNKNAGALVNEAHAHNIKVVFFDPLTMYLTNPRHDYKAPIISTIPSVIQKIESVAKPDALSNLLLLIPSPHSPYAQQEPLLHWCTCTSKSDCSMATSNTSGTEFLKPLATTIA